MVDNMLEILTKEYSLREELEDFYKTLLEMVKLEDTFNQTYNIFAVPRHLGLLNEVSRELKMESYIPNCVRCI